MRPHLHDVALEPLDEGPHTEEPFRASPEVADSEPFDVADLPFRLGCKRCVHAHAGYDVQLDLPLVYGDVNEFFWPQESRDVKACLLTDLSDRTRNIGLVLASLPPREAPRSSAVTSPN
eukprot:CAMPEP_0177590546 /NCGR_PEP_ID=MMETSP0419_2-20121207/7473_1 /TAXON_ID=582737 /ORGANISM="Tetraselmis sp., Strain GSL018" /LENGTH=118 /DNA_ID=CAMNT_0019081131 /DNA_START=754 /DNA_END=1110 /DNA_ORIENTATION=-